MKQLLARLIKPSTTNGDVLTTVSGKTAWGPPPSGGTTTTKRLLAFKRSGTLSVGTGATRFYNDTGSSWTINSVRASVETAPSGGTVVIDVNVNDVTIFTTQANRPTVAAGALTSGQVTNMDVTTVAAGQYLTIDIDTATAPSANLTVQIGVTA